jgi:bis(5'-nucleosyl)-tetraphosphatase (symmetrical)
MMTTQRRVGPDGKMRVASFAALLFSTVSFGISESSFGFLTSQQCRVVPYYTRNLGLISRPKYALTRFSCSFSYTPDKFKQCIDSEDGRYIVVGDVHGCKEEMIDLLNTLKFKADCDRLIFVGDVIAKGPDSLGCLEMAHSLGSVMVLGNHELKVLQIVDSIASGQTKDYKNSEHSTIARVLLDDCNDKLLHYLKKAPACVSMNNTTLIVHAGLMPQTKPEENSLTTLTTMRSLVICDGVLKPSAELGEAPWAASWNGPETVVFGHDAARGLQVIPLKSSLSCCHLTLHFLDFWQIHPKAFGLDSGCVYGGKLTALVLPDQTLVSVPAARTYCPIRSRPSI